MGVFQPAPKGATTKSGTAKKKPRRCRFLQSNVAYKSNIMFKGYMGNLEQVVFSDHPMNNPLSYIQVSKVNSTDVMMLLLPFIPAFYKGVA